MSAGSEKYIYLVHVICLLSTWMIEGTDGRVNSSYLIDTLLKGYKSYLRPVCGEDAPVQVTIGLAIRQIIDMNEPRQILETNAWIRLAWNDCHFTWNSTETGIDSLVVPYGTIWVPDITLYDNAESVLHGLEDYRQYIMYDGMVYYNFPTIIKSLCKVDVTYFPFDVQICRFKFGSWMHHGNELNLSMAASAGDTTVYRSNGEWQILGAPGIRHVIMYLCCPEPYPDVTFYLKLERRPLFYLLNLIFPCSVISTVAILTFLLPPESGEKVSLCITVLLSLAVFLLVVSETMPPTSETFPFIGLYFASCMLLVSISCLMTVTVLNFHHKGNHGRKVPSCIRKLFIEVLGKLLCIKASHYENSLHHFGVRSHTNDVQTNDLNHSSVRSHKIPNGVLADHENNFFYNLNELKQKSERSDSNEIKTSSEVINILHRQLDFLQKLGTHSDYHERIGERVNEWQLVAKVMDRIFFVIFFCVKVSAVVGILVGIATADKTRPLEN